MRAARPVLDDLRSLLEDVRVGIALTDADVQVLDTAFTDLSVSDSFEENRGTPGYSWAEEHVGTSAIALAAKNRRATYVRGAEHYWKAARDVTAAAAPIFDPFSEEVAGALVLSGPLSDASPHMLAAVVQAARVVQQSLYEQGSVSDHLLLARFLAERARSGEDAVFVVNESMVLSNGPGTALLHSLDRATLWEQALDSTASMQGSTATNLLTLRDGRSLTARFEKSDPGSVRGGVLVRVTSEEAAPARGDRTRVRRAPARPVRRYLDLEIARAVSQAGGILISGEPGSGKLAVAEEIHHQLGHAQLAIADAAKDLNGTGSDLRRDLMAAAAEPDTTLVLRHVECLGLPALTALRGTLGDGAGRARIVATMNADPHRPERSDLGDLFPSRVQVPPLRDRVDELPALVATLMRRHGATGQMQPAAIEALGRHEWPGNIRELDATIKTVVAARRTCDITVRDLPMALTSVVRPRRLTRMEHLERAAIRRALIEAGGNRTQAAATLQIGRATLYRKLKSFGLESEVYELPKTGLEGNTVSL